MGLFSHSAFKFLLGFPVARGSPGLMAAFEACFSWIWSSWGLNTLTDMLETWVLHMALSNIPKFHCPCSGMSPQCCLQGLPISHAIWVVELSRNRDVLGARPHSTPHGLWWTWKVWAPPTLKSICFHRTFFLSTSFLIKDISLEKSQPAVAQGPSPHSFLSCVSGASLHLSAENQP